MYFFFFQAEDGIRDYKVTGVQTCALPISPAPTLPPGIDRDVRNRAILSEDFRRLQTSLRSSLEDRKSTRLNSSHLVISYAVFCLKKKKNANNTKDLRHARTNSNQNGYHCN